MRISIGPSLLQNKAASILQTEIRGFFSPLELQLNTKSDSYG